ncbi:MAG: dTDP-4-dehydrorhamnose reductase [Thermotaleaceae bacterium]
MKLLITGSHGQLGRELQKLYEQRRCSLGSIPKAYQDIQLFWTHKDTLDITNLEDMREKLKALRPQIVINTAAYTQVDQCEINQDQAFQNNAMGPRNLAMVCEEIRAKLLHLSTDYVFDGKSTVPYSEFDMPHPINIYGKTKYLGEEYIKQFSSRYFIVRTGWLYGMEGKNFVKTILHASKEKKELQIVSDQIGTPTYGVDLAYHLLHLALTDEYGIYHCTGNGQCSWYEFAKSIFAYAHRDCSIHPISSEEYPTLAPRPHYSTLDNSMLRCTIGDSMRNWKEALVDFMKNFN